MTAHKQRLGRGLAALIGDDADEEIVMDDGRGSAASPSSSCIPIRTIRAAASKPPISTNWCSRFGRKAYCSP
jgi:hypothetical protein